jgi:hypothetical protein
MTRRVEDGPNSEHPEGRVKMPRGTQLSVCLENKPGQLAKLSAALGRAKVNIRAISVVDSSDCGIVRLITSANAKAKQVLTKAGMAVVQQPVVLVRAADEPGVLADIARKLAAAKVNVDYVYGSACGCMDSLLVIGTDDVAKAAKAV